MALVMLCAVTSSAIAYRLGLSGLMVTCRIVSGASEAGLGKTCPVPSREIHNCSRLVMAGHAQ